MNVALAATLFGTFFGLLVVGVPVALSLGLAAVACLFLFDLGSLQLVPQLMVSATNSWTLLAVPFFVLAGNLLDTPNSLSGWYGWPRVWWDRFRVGWRW